MFQQIVTAVVDYERSLPFIRLLKLSFSFLGLILLPIGNVEVIQINDKTRTVWGKQGIKDR